MFDKKEETGKMSHMNRKRAEAGVVFPRLDASNEKTEANMHDVTTMGTARGDDEPPPDGGYGWVCVAACFMINCFTWGTVSVSPKVLDFP